MPPSFAFTAFTSARSSVSQSKLRCALIGWFSGVGGGGEEPDAGEVDEGAHAGARRRPDAGGIARDREQTLRHRHRGRRLAREAVGEEARSARRRARRPRAGLLDHVVGRRAHERGEEVEGRDAVRDRVVRLHEQREAIVGEALDHPELPERFPAIELLRHDARRQLLQLRVVPGRGTAVWRTW